MKTIALKEKTFHLLRELKEREHADSFDEVVIELIGKEHNVGESLFGSLKGKIKKFTPADRRRLWKDAYRE